MLSGEKRGKRLSWFSQVPSRNHRLHRADRYWSCYYARFCYQCWFFFLSEWKQFPEEETWKNNFCSFKKKKNPDKDRDSECRREKNTRASGPLTLMAKKKQPSCFVVGGVAPETGVKTCWKQPLNLSPSSSNISHNTLIIAGAAIHRRGWTQS